jgi:hypothetical protein
VHGRADDAAGIEMLEVDRLRGGTHLTGLVAPVGAASSLELKPPSEQVPFCDAESRRGELDIRGRVSNIAITPSGRIWIPTCTGQTYYADDVLGDWKAGALDLSSDDEVRVASQCIDRVSFFNDNVAFASGYISSTNSSLEDTIYRTIDGGVVVRSIAERGPSPVRFERVAS